MANGVSTQWFDLQVKFGNYLPNQKQTTLYQQQKVYQDKKNEQNKLQNVLNTKTNEEIRQLEDDLDQDDEFFKQYMKKRYAQINTLAKKAKYGSVFEISRDQYVKQVTEADPQSFVVLHLYQNYIQTCNLINQHLISIANKYPLVKFIKMVATKCIQQFPDSRCPCFIVYRGGKLVSNICNVDKYLTKNIESLELFLQGQGVFNFELQKQQKQEDD